MAEQLGCVDDVRVGLGLRYGDGIHASTEPRVLVCMGQRIESELTPNGARALASLLEVAAEAAERKAAGK